MKFVSIFILFILTQFTLRSCPKCNQDFYEELLSSRANTLGGQELLNAIKNQQIEGQPVSFIQPTAYNDLTDIKQPDSKDNKDNNNSSETSNQSNYYSYIYIITQLIFPGRLIT